jgi:hypothetical protein
MTGHSTHDDRDREHAAEEGDGSPGPTQERVGDEHHGVAPGDLVRIALVAAAVAAHAAASSRCVLWSLFGARCPGFGIRRKRELCRWAAHSFHPDDDLAFCTARLDVRHGLVDGFERKDPIHHRAYGPRFDERGDLS